jgi:putative ABC transport system permease protein
LIVAYTLSVVVTFLTITVSSWRVSRLNIVRAIRDIPEPVRHRASLRRLILGLLGVVAGAVLMWVGNECNEAFAFAFGISLIPLSLAAALRRFGVPARLLYSIASLLVLAYWLAPQSLRDEIFPELDGGMEMFFLSGIMMVAASTVAIIWNSEMIAAGFGLFGCAFSRWLPAVKAAVAYPLASKGRTGMTMAMFSLIVFSLVMMVAIDANFSALFSSEKATGGWDIQASQSPNNPVPNFTQALVDNGVDTSMITATGRLDQVPQARGQARMAGVTDRARYAINGVDADFVNNSSLSLQIRASGYESDQAVWDAVRDNPDLAVVDGQAVVSEFRGGGDPAPAGILHLAGVEQGDTTMEPAKVDIGDAVTGKTHTVP